MFMWIRAVPAKVIGGQRYVRLKDSCFGEVQVPRKTNFDIYAFFVHTVIEEYRKRNRNVTPNLINCFRFIRAKWSVAPQEIISYLEENPKKFASDSQIIQVYIPLMKKCVLPRLKGKK
jgi:hypothetical protein